MTDKKDQTETLETFEPTAEEQHEKAENVHPLTEDLEDYRNTLGDGTERFRGLESGFNQIDELIGGLDRFVLLAGRSGAGKTTLALQLALGVAKHAPVLIYSFEMSRYEIITSLVKATAHELRLGGLYTKTIELQGRDPNLDADLKEAIKASLKELNDRTGERLFIKDSSTGIPSILPYNNTQSITMYDDIEQIKALTGSDRILVLIDSIQDVVNTQNPNQVQAEIQAVNDLTILQQKTGATILATAQKNKGSVNSQDSYGDVMGSMSFIHKPNTVIELNTLNEMINRADKTERDDLRDLANQIEQDAKAGKCKPMFLNVIKGRFTGTDKLPLRFYGAFGYFEAGEELGYSDVYERFNNY